MAVGTNDTRERNRCNWVDFKRGRCVQEAIHVSINSLSASMHEARPVARPINYLVLSRTLHSLPPKLVLGDTGRVAEGTISCVEGEARRALPVSDRKNACHGTRVSTSTQRSARQSRAFRRGSGQFRTPSPPSQRSRALLPLAFAASRPTATVTPAALT